MNEEALRESIQRWAFGTAATVEQHDAATGVLKEAAATMRTRLADSIAHLEATEKELGAVAYGQPHQRERVRVARQVLREAVSLLRAMEGGFEHLTEALLEALAQLREHARE